jgi:hypothetical protein
MIGEQELSQLIQGLRQYHRAVAATRAGLHQLQTPEAQDQLQQRLQAAYAIKAGLEEEISGFLLDARLLLEAELRRLETARSQSREQHSAE